MIEYVDPFPGHLGTERVFETCGKCHGTGFYNAPTGITWTRDRALGNQPYCLACKGAGQTSILVSSARSAERRRVKAANEARESAKRYELAREYFVGAEGDRIDALRSALENLREGSPLAREAGYLDDEAAGIPESVQIWASKVDELLAKVAAVESAKRPVPTGRIVVEGVVLSTKLVESDYGVTLKMLVEGDGWKVWGTRPRSIEVERGSRVRFTATVEASREDASFGFYSRPTKAEILA